MKCVRKLSNPCYWILKILTSFIGLVLVDYFAKRWFEIEFYSVGKFFLMWAIGIILSVMVDLIFKRVE